MNLQPQKKVTPPNKTASEANGLRASIKFRTNNSGEPIGPILSRKVPGQMTEQPAQESPPQNTGQRASARRDLRKNFLTAPEKDVQLPAIPRAWAQRRFEDLRKRNSAEQQS